MAALINARVAAGVDRGGDTGGVAVLRGARQPLALLHSGGGPTYYPYISPGSKFTEVVFLKNRGLSADFLALLFTKKNMLSEKFEVSILCCRIWFGIQILGLQCKQIYLLVQISVIVGIFNFYYLFFSIRNYKLMMI